jgi:hypothetical protein
LRDGFREPAWSEAIASTKSRSVVSAVNAPRHRHEELYVASLDRAVERPCRVFMSGWSWGQRSMLSSEQRRDLAHEVVCHAGLVPDL